MKIVKNHFTVHKFGGSSLADANRFKAVKQILDGKKEIIVVSAIKGTTSTLQNSLDLILFAYILPLSHQYYQ